MRAGLWTGLVAVIIALLAQLLIAGIQYLLNKNVDFPPSILAMAVVFSVFLACGRILPGVELFYMRHLRQPADLLNRHMSIGFTIPFVMICRNPLASPHTIGLIILCFVLTGVLNTFSTYALSLPLQGLMVRWDKRFCGKQTSKAEGLRVGGPVSESEGQKRLFHESASISSSVSVGLDPEVAPDEDRQQSFNVTDAANAQPHTKLARFFTFALNYPMLLLSWTLTLTVGLPLRLVSPATTVLSTTLLSAIWLTTLTLQSHLKTTTSLPPALRTLLSGLTNAVLCTSLALIALAFAESAASRQPLHAVLATLQTNMTLPDLILSATTTSTTPRPVPTMAAGDIALCILNAGLVSWGLKLYEYRAQLLSRAGLTVFSVSSLLALGNVALGPLLARAVGLGPASRDLAFAARSVTLALGSPVMAMLGGDGGLNAAIVVVSGIVFQMGLGFGVGGWMERRVRGFVGAWGASAAAACCRDHADDPRTVAAGVTIGINAAAMGTAYLYEVKSDAAPYSALSMMALGIMTVVFSTIQPLAHWVVEHVSSAATNA
ncbi:hypothetical protein B0H67DRAFT_492063 [Lasiosphaeris hirsuta]|uniref:LrgB-like protein n=1 Tax=Lasiosphaeris hirsuta TaxID=260670 RepID=A0AA40A9W9_9PEZI|nr:hypothetical protein B0H67DRAFT_492063 [Lasiosphaeris hirsuta]